MSESRLYLTCDWSKEGAGYLAVITYGQPQLGDKNVTVLDAKVLPSKRECRSWFRKMRQERPWETRQ